MSTRSRTFLPRSFLPIVLAAILLLLAQCFFLYGHTGRDDAFLTYWPARTLVNYGAILNFNGERVEQSSTLLHTINLASFQLLLPDVAMPTIAWLVSMAGGIMTLLLLAMTLCSQRIHPGGILVLASAPSLVYWSSSGMETTASTALFMGILLLCLQENFPRRNGWLAVVTALAVLNRPEAFAVLFCFGVGGWLLSVMFDNQNQDRSRWRTLLLATMATFAAVSLWRYMYFGAWFPQPVSAKHSDPGLVNAVKGLFYIVWGGGSRITSYITGAGLLAWFLALIYRAHPHRMPVLFCGMIALSQIAFILASGGDWMEATRFLLPVLPALLLCGILFLAKWPRFLRITIATVFVLTVYDSWQFARHESSGLAFHERKTIIGRYLPDSTMAARYSTTELQSKDALRDIPQLENLVSVIRQIESDTTRPATEKVNIASIQMGFIPYHLSKALPSRLHFLDLRGLSTPELTQCSLFQLYSRSEYGVKVGLDDLLGMLTELNRQCGIAKPDIIYDLGYEVRKQALADNGYILTYREKRSIKGDFSIRPIGSDLFVAVRKELAAQYNIKDVHGNVPVLPQEASQTSRPNIVFVIADDISYDNFGFMGSAAAKTPTIDQLAQQGTVFTTAYVPTAFCRPSMGTLLTGQWPQQHRLHANRGVIALPPGYVTLATRLQQHGYTTFTGGKFWEDEPELRGFDAYDSDWKQFARANQDKLWQFLDQHAGKQPMFISWAPMLPHTPHNPSQQFLDAIDENAIYVQPDMPADKRDIFRQREKVLLAMNLWFDSEFRKFHDRLAEKKQLENTLFIFMADNGFSNRSYSKSTPYELGLRTPVIFSWPGHVPFQRIDSQTDTIHLFNTVLDFAGVPAPTSAPYSRSLRPVIEQKVQAVPEKLFGADYQSIAMKTDPVPRPERDIYALHLRDGEWKYIFYLRDLREENNFDLTFQNGMMPFLTRNAGDEDLFHLPKDRYEEKNLSADPAQKQRLEDYRRQVLEWWYKYDGKPFDAISQCPAQPEVLCRKIEAVYRSHISIPIDTRH